MGILRGTSDCFGELRGTGGSPEFFTDISSGRGPTWRPPVPPVPPVPTGFSGGTGYPVAHLPHLCPRGYQFSDNQDSDKFLGVPRIQQCTPCLPVVRQICHMCHLCHTLTARFRTCGTYTTQPVALLPAQNSPGDKRLHRFRGTCAILGQPVQSLGN